MRKDIWFMSVHASNVRGGYLYSNFSERMENEEKIRVGWKNGVLWLKSFKCGHMWDEKKMKQVDEKFEIEDGKRNKLLKSLNLKTYNEI